MEFRTIAAHERNAVLDLLREWFGDRAFFARYFEHDPSFRDDLCFVAVDAGRIVSTLQVFRKHVRLGGAVLEVGGVGNVFTTDSYRERGLASELLRRALAAMDAHGFDATLLFAVRLPFYSSHGWQSVVRHLVYIEPGAAVTSGAYRLERFAPADLAAVMALYDAFTAALNGPTVRDADYWRGQLRYAGNPHEDFVVARNPDGQLVAYARATPLYEFYVLTEYAYRLAHADALAQIIAHLHSTAGAPYPGTITQLAIAPEVQERLTARGLTLRTVEDFFWMWQVIAPQQLAAKLGVTQAEVQREDFWPQALPPDGSVYWLADRF